MISNDNDTAFDMKMSSDSDVEVNVQPLKILEANVSTHRAHHIELINNHNPIAIDAECMFNLESSHEGVIG